MWTLMELHRTAETRDGAIFGTELLGTIWVKFGLSDTEKLALCKEYGGDQLISLSTKATSKMTLSEQITSKEPATKFIPKGDKLCQSSPSLRTEPSSP